MEKLNQTNGEKGLLKEEIYLGATLCKNLANVKKQQKHIDWGPTPLSPAPALSSQRVQNYHQDIIIKISIKKIHFISKNFDIIRSCINTDYIVVKRYKLINILAFYSQQINQEQILIIMENYQQLFHTFFGSYVYQGNILI